MIRHDAAQGTDEWFAARRGIPSASMADKILSPTGIPSKQADAYANQLIAERLTGLSGGFQGNTHTDRGTELEPEARAYYAFVSGCEVEEVGFCLTDDGTFGCSPDGMVGDDGMVEIKAPSPANHIGYLLGGKVPTAYLAQVQSQLFVTGRAWLDFMSYAPSLDPLLIRVEPDLEWHDRFEKELEKFTRLLAYKMDKLKERGVI